VAGLTLDSSPRSLHPVGMTQTKTFLASVGVALAFSGASVGVAQALVGSKAPALSADLTFIGGRGGDPGNDYPAKWRDIPMDSVFDLWGEYNRECTSFVAWALATRNNFNVPFHDNAIGWKGDAQFRGFAVNSTPAVGSVAWSGAGEYGHVAWVSAISGENVIIEEYNENFTGTYDQRSVPASSFLYIHFRDIATPPPPPPPSAAPTVLPTGGERSAIQPSSPSSSPPARPLTSPPPAPPRSTPAPDATPTQGPAPQSSSPPPPSSSPPPPSPPPPSPSPQTFSETTGGVTHTWTNYGNAGGTEGQSIASNQTVQISCKVQGFQVADGDTWWYRIASTPWSNTYYASADAFYNNGETSGTLAGTPYVDNNVPNC
jgi:surface antigen